MAKLVKVGQTVYVPCIDPVNHVSFVLPITVVSDKVEINTPDSEHIRYVHRKWMNDHIKAGLVVHYKSRNRAEMELKRKLH
jgi:hypothetical protein